MPVLPFFQIYQTAANASRRAKGEEQKEEKVEASRIRSGISSEDPALLYE